MTADEIRLELLLFQVSTLLGFSVRVTRTDWELISTIKHPVMGRA